MKVISLIVTIILLMTVMSVPSYATDVAPLINEGNNQELCLSQYTLEDLSNMTPSQFNTLLSDFERIYDPFGSYKKKQIASLKESQNMVTPRWTSGDDNDGTHAIITAKACEVLSNDIEFFANDVANAVVATLCISLASTLPDDDETDNIFEGHFYDPDTEQNYNDGTENTAKTNAVSHYRAAYTAAADNDIEYMYEEIGRTLHYIQDVNVPHHAANIVSLGPLSSHARFEKLAEENLNSYIDNLTTLNSSEYTNIGAEYVRDIVKIAATDAKAKYPILAEIDDKDSYEWSTVARFCTRKSVKYSAIIMYKLAQRSEIPFYFN